MGTAANTGVWSDASLGSNIRAASSFLERRTSRQFEALTGTTKTFTTDGRTYMVIPDLRSVSSLALNDAALTSDETYYLIPDRHDTSIYTGIQFRAFRRHGRPDGWWLHSSEWFDRNYDNPRGPYYNEDTSLPNDLVITGNWGWDPLPDDLLQATKVLAAYYTKRPDAVLANVEITPEGNARLFRDLPMEVSEFIMDWKLGERISDGG